MSTPEFFAPLAETMKRTVAALREAEVPHMLGGSLAAWARGGPTPEHDLDVMVKPEDARRAQQALVEIGMRPEDPPEGWLLKAWDGEVLVDLIYRPIESPVTDATLADTVMRPVEAISMPVLSATQLMMHKLLSYTKHYCDFATWLPVARSLREQIDWDRVRRETAQSPYAEAFLVLLDRLEVVPLPGDAQITVGG